MLVVEHQYFCRSALIADGRFKQVRKKKENTEVSKEQVRSDNAGSGVGTQEVLVRSKARNEHKKKTTKVFCGGTRNGAKNEKEKT